MSQKKTFPLDPRPAQLLERYHRRTRKRAPWLQAVLFAAGGYRDAKPGIGYVAQRAGATVLPCHLFGTRGLYRPWTWPRITITYGPPIAFERVPEPQREANAEAAARIADAVKALAP